MFYNHRMLLLMKNHHEHDGKFKTVYLEVKKNEVSKEMFLKICLKTTWGFYFCCCLKYKFPEF